MKKVEWHQVAVASRKPPPDFLDEQRLKDLAQLERINQRLWEIEAERNFHLLQWSRKETTSDLKIIKELEQTLEEEITDE